MSKITQHVVPAPNGGWVVRTGRAYRASKHFLKKEDAVKWARRLSINQKSELVIHRGDGTIQSKVSFGNDPLQPDSHRR